MSFLLLAAAPAVDHPWARATAPGQQVSAAYLQITSAQDDVLEGVEVDGGMAMLHRSTSEAGMSGMVDAGALTLPAGRPVVLAPGGTHVMLTGLAHGLHVGERVRLRLRLRAQGVVAVDAPVLPIGARGP